MPAAATSEGAGEGAGTERHSLGASTRTDSPAHFLGKVGGAMKGSVYTFVNKEISSNFNS